MKWFVLSLLAVTVCGVHAGEVKWYKGNTHTHTFWSDGKEFPETAADTYRKMGYDFLVLSDHNVVSRGERWVNYNEQRMKPAVDRAEKRWGKDHLQFREKDDKRQVRLMPLVEVRKLVEADGDFIMIEGVELTAGLADGRQIHSNPINISKPLRVKSRSDHTTVEEELAHHEKLVHDHIAESDHPVFWHINHPNWKLSLSGEQLAAVKGAHGVELMNGSNGCLNEGDGAELPPVSQIWDVANTLRLKEGLQPIYGCATDDTHQYHHAGPHASGPGLAWIMVKSSEFTPDAITEAMLRGDFYASTGITLKMLELDRKAGTYTVAVDPQAGVNYIVEIVGSTVDKTGVVLQKSEGARAVYRLTGDELFVRATITCDAPPICDYDEVGPVVPKAWTQPVGWRK